MIPVLHPLIVHFPIVLLLAAGIAQLLVLKWPQLERTTTWLLVFGLLTGFAAYMTGDDGKRYAIEHFGTARSAIDTHENFAFWTMLVFCALFASRIIYHYFGYRGLIALQTVLAVAGIVLIVLTGHFGGSLVYQPGSAAGLG